MRRVALAVALLTACSHPAREVATVPIVPPAPSTDARIYSGFYVESSRESIFYPCGGSAGSPGWWLRFLPTVKNADRARYQYDGPGMPASNHFIVVRGTLSAPGFFGYGFQLRQIVVDSVLDIRDPQGCPNAYNSAPRRWDGIGFVGRIVSAVAVSREANLTAVAINKGMVSIWDNASGEKISEYRFGPPSDPSVVPTIAMAFSSSGKLLAIGCDDGWIQVIRVSSGKLQWKLDHSAHSETIGKPGGPVWATYGVFPVASVAFTPDEQILVSTGGARAYTWSMSSGKKISKLFGSGINRDAAPSQVVTTSDPARILGYSATGTLSVYPVAGGDPLLTVAVPKAGYLNGYGMKISPDGRFVAIRESPDTVSLWSMTEGKVTHRFGVPPFSSGDFAFTSDGTRLAIPGGSFSIYVWNTISGAPVAQLRAPHAGAYRLWFTPNGDSLVMSAHFDSTLLVSPMPTRGGATRDLIFTRGKLPDEKLAVLFGAVTDSLTGLFQAEIAVFSDSASRTPIKWTRSDEDGLFVIDSLSPGRVLMRVRRIGYNALSRELELVTGLNSVAVPMKRSGGLEVITTASAEETSRR